MTKRDAKKKEVTKGNLVMDMEPEESFYGLCSPLPETPSKSPNPKKLCGENKEKDTVSNSDILQAIRELKRGFSVFEQQMKQNTADIKEAKEVMKGLNFQAKETEDKVITLDKRVDELKEKTEEGERYSRRWNLRLINLPEKENEDVRHEVLKILSQIAPDEKSKMGFLVDTVHRVGRPRDDNKPRPVIIQFNMRTFRIKIWRESRNADILKKMNLRMAEDLTRFEKDCRNKLWPLVEQARKDGKKTRWQGPIVFIDGVKFTA
ncbi:uncharacterized protein PAE49_011494 isoform 1-T1 [Odontesthes bonariensis]|uniref:uncharacterized protein LOC142390724 isoform X1 n=1 Tax=Odontesthes bonariensis TaxID=219752 RepID=UPI003F58BF6D